MDNEEEDCSMELLLKSNKYYHPNGVGLFVDSPERRLLVAIIIRAVFDASTRSMSPKLGKVHRDSPTRDEFSKVSLDAKRWLSSNSTETMSFLWVAQMLGLSDIEITRYQHYAGV